MRPGQPAAGRDKHQGGQPALLISLDFELYWGVHDLHPVDGCEEYLAQTRSAISRLLDLFRDYQIHATWATVGFLFHRNREELLSGLPQVLPSYANPSFSPYPALSAIGADAIADPCRYGADILEAVRNTPHQEIGTHTFSHCYCLEHGFTEEAFRSDLEAAVRAARTWNIELRSLVFPRNQVNPAYLNTVRQLGIACYRDNPKHWLYRECRWFEESQLRRALRLLDHYIDISGHHTFDPRDMHPSRPLAFPASRLLRSYNPKLRLFEPLRIARIHSGLRHAARHGHVFHLWLHPEELALHQDRNLAMVRQVLDCFAALRSSAGMKSLNMGELASRLAPSFAGSPAGEVGHALMGSPSQVLTS